MKATLLFVLLSIAATAEATQTITAQVNGMVCAFCAQGIEKKARALPQVEDVYVNLKKKIVAVQIKNGAALDEKTITALVKEAGYDVSQINVVDETTAAIRKRFEHE
jgi:periplasmic mercuric ion binding protein